MSCILLTGFEPFGGYGINSSWELVSSLPDAIGDFECIKLRLPVEFKAVSESVPKILAEHNPDVIFAFGQSIADVVRVERVAINIDDARMPDNSGYCPIDTQIQNDGASAYFATVPIKLMQQATINAITPAVISNSAGTYVCNHLFYELLYWCEKLNRKTQVGFIHLPRLPQQVENPDGNSMSLNDIKNLVLEIIKAL